MFGLYIGTPVVVVPGDKTWLNRFGATGLKLLKKVVGAGLLLLYAFVLYLLGFLIGFSGR